MFKISIALITLKLIQVKAGWINFQYIIRIMLILSVWLITDWCHVCHQLENKTCLKPMNNAFSKECDEDMGFSCYMRLIGKI